MQTIGAAGMKGLMEIVMESHAGKSADEFEQAEANGWIIVSMKGDWNIIFTDN